jgi:general secretion pathway protein D
MAICAAAFLSLCACTPSLGPHSENDSSDLATTGAIAQMDLRARSPQATPTVDTGSSVSKPASFFGAPTAQVAREDNSSNTPVVESGEGVTLNFENTPIAAVAKVILSDLMGANYTIDPHAQGSISLSSSRPVAKKDLVFVLENALRANNLILVRAKSGYNILPANGNIVGGVDRPAGDDNSEPGYGMTVIPVHYVSAPTLAKLMEGFSVKPGAIRSDPNGNLLYVIGSGPERQTAIETVRNFDADWMKGQSVGIYPVHNSAPEPVIAELERIMDTGDSGLGHNLLKFQVIERQNAILVVASKPELLRTASTWINRLDSSATTSTGVKVYKVKFGDARQLAALLNDMFVASPNGGQESASNEIAPSSRATTLSTVDRLTGGAGQQTGGARQNSQGFPAISPAAQTIGAAQTTGAAQLGRTLDYGALASLDGAIPTSHVAASALGTLSGVRITADLANNAILVYADQTNYRTIVRALDQLDRPKLQVAIDLTIAEVDLNKDLAYGVQFFLSNKYGALINSAGQTSGSSAASSSASAITTAAQTLGALPGFNLVVGNPATPRVILNALDQYTKVKVLSNPSLVVVDNQPATLEVGDQVPVTTGTATVLSANNAVVNTVSYQNTGIILNVLPRVNSNGNVLLDIEQEISEVPASSAGSLTPTISQRKVKSTISVASGQTVLLAGLISDTRNDVRSGVPILDTLPLIGGVFGNTDKSTARTELIIFIRPQIIRNGADAAAVAEQLRTKMRGGELLPAISLPTKKLQ